MSSTETKFDEFIESYDKSLNKDTSTISTITPSSPAASLGQPLVASNQQHSQQQTPSSTPLSSLATNKMKEASSPDKEGIVSPILSTPTKSSRNSVSLDKQPLKTESSEVKPVSLIQSLEKSQSPPPPAMKRSVSHQRHSSASDIKRSISVKKRGFNLNLALNHEKNQKDSTTATTPRTPSNNISPMQRKLSVSSKPESVRVRSNSIKQLEETEAFNQSLRELAAKEMRIFEIKSEIKLLTEKLEKEQDDLAKLRNEISTSLYKDLNSLKSPPPPPKPISKDTPEPSVTSTPYKAQEPIKPSIDTSTPSHPQSEPAITPSGSTSSSISNTSNPPKPPPKEVKSSRRISQYWSKPINFINQFDQILQNEFDKLNTTSASTSQVEVEDNQSIASLEATSSRSSPMKSGKERNTTDEVLKNVSNSIWSFMSDVKSGLLGEEENAFLNQQNNHGQLNQVNEDVNGEQQGIDNLHIDDNGNTIEQEMVTIRK